MRLSGLFLAAILLISIAVWAQHSSGGGGDPPRAEHPQAVRTAGVAARVRLVDLPAVTALADPAGDTAPEARFRTVRVFAERRPGALAGRKQPESCGTRFMG
jgi:hypothetical protein